MKKQKQIAQKKVRTLFSELDPTLINFASTDYLNLASHPYVKKEGIAYAMKWGSGLLPTRGLPSYELALKATEELFAKLLGFETVTFYESDPYLLNPLTSLNEKPILLQNSISRRTGMIHPLEELLLQKKETKSILAVNDSLSFSVLGANGFGLMAGQSGIDILLGSFSKCFGHYVSFIATSKELKSALFEKIPVLHKEQFIAPLFLGMIDASIKLIPSMDSERKKLIKLNSSLFKTLRKIGFEPIDTKAPFVPLTVERSAELKKLGLHLSDHSFITSPSPSGLIFFPNTNLTEKNIAQLLKTFTHYRSDLHIEAL
jgi:7-keto-8-aminopelargonate synthetase-like enzyme